MKNYRKDLIITTDEPQQFMNLSFDVEECVRQSCITNGICVVMSQHCTSSVFLGHDNEKLEHDWLRAMSAVSEETEYTVDYAPAGAQHIRAMLLGGSVSVPISEGKLELGPRQYIMYGDFDGCREKIVVVKIIGE